MAKVNSVAPTAATAASAVASITNRNIRARRLLVPFSGRSGSNACSMIFELSAEGCPNGLCRYSVYMSALALCPAELLCIRVMKDRPKTMTANALSHISACTPGAKLDMDPPNAARRTREATPIGAKSGRLPISARRRRLPSSSMRSASVIILKRTMSSCVTGPELLCRSQEFSDPRVLLFVLILQMI